MIKIDGLRKAFGPIEALRGVSLSINSGRITGLVGPNACGKSTLIKSILGLVLPDAGEIYVDDDAVLGHYAYRNKIGYMPQNPDYPSNLNVRELFSMLEDVREIKAKLRDDLIEVFDLAPVLGRSFSHLSGGTRQKVSIVVSMMFDPAILILDEPTVGLDPISVVRLKRLIVERAKQGTTVLLVSHIMSELEQLVEDVVFLLEGTVFARGSLADLLARTGTSRLEEAVVCLMEGIWEK